MIHGLDTAARRWHVVREDGGHDSHTVRPSVATDEARVELAASWRDYVDSNVTPGDVIVCEQPLSLSNGKTSRVLAMAAGAIHLATYHPVERPDVSWQWVDVELWKRYIVGQGGVDKDQIAAFVFITYGLTFSEADFCDALCIRDYGKLTEFCGAPPLSQKELKKQDPEVRVALLEAYEIGAQCLAAWRAEAGTEISAS